VVAQEVVPQGIRRPCAAEGVATVRGLRLLLNLASLGAMTKKRALLVGRLIHESNPHHISAKLLEEFKIKLDGI
jgi:hypothetical protein